MPGKRIFNQRPNVVGRNGNIWAAHIAGANQQQLADAFDLSVQRVSQILDQVRKSIPADEKAQVRTMRLELLNELKMQMMEIALSDAPPAFAPNGKPHFDPETHKTVRDVSVKLNAVDRLLKIDERIAKATGTDSAVEHTVQVSAEAQQATLDAATSVGRQFALLIPESPEVRAHSGSG